jgi:site-specific recombinase XerD
MEFLRKPQLQRLKPYGLALVIIVMFLAAIWWLDKLASSAGYGPAFAISAGIFIVVLAVIQTLLGTGLRISELVALTVSDLEITPRKGTLYVRQGKGSKAREIPLGARTRRALLNYLEERGGSNSRRLFLGQRGPLNEPGISYLVSKYAYQALLEEVTPHSLRHSFAKNLIDAATPLDQVATLLGHASLDTTKIYIRPSKQDLERAVRRAAGEI